MPKTLNGTILLLQFSCFPVLNFPVSIKKDSPNQSKISTPAASNDTSRFGSLMAAISAGDFFASSA
jgi:hypothetical protein